MVLSRRIGSGSATLWVKQLYIAPDEVQTRPSIFFHTRCRILSPQAKNIGYVFPIGCVCNSTATGRMRYNPQNWPGTCPTVANKANQPPVNPCNLPKRRVAAIDRPPGGRRGDDF